LRLAFSSFIFVAMQPATKKTDDAWAAMPTPAWGVDPPVAAGWEVVVPNPLSKAKAPPADIAWDGLVPPPPGSTAFPTIDPAGGKEWAMLQMSDIEKRRAGAAETLLAQVKAKTDFEAGVKKVLAAAAADDGPAGQSKASLKRARQKEAARLAAGAPSSSSSGPLVVAEASASQQSDDDDDEARLVRQLVAVRAKKLSAAAVQAKMDMDADTDAEAAAAEVKGEGPNQFVCVGPEPGSNANAVGPAGQGIGKRKAVILDEQRFKDSGRKVPVGRGMQAAKGKGKGKAEDPNQLACVGSNAAPDPESDYPSDLGGSSPFWPSRDLPEEEQMAAMKVLSCCSCAIGPLKRSDMVLWNDGRSASWQGKSGGVGIAST
jgi:hypothetical protein